MRAHMNVPVPGTLDPYQAIADTTRTGSGYGNPPAAPSHGRYLLQSGPPGWRNANATRLDGSAQRLRQ